jgi:hypothetical protein
VIADYYIPEAPALVAERPERPRTSPLDRLDWDALAWCESRGVVDVVDASGTYGGLYQFDATTWQGVGGVGLPQDATAREQLKRAKMLYRIRGDQPWPVCGGEL